MTTPTIKRNPWSWIPTLYFAEGLPYVAVMTIAVIMYKRLGLSNTEKRHGTGISRHGGIEGLGGSYAERDVRRTEATCGHRTCLDRQAADYIGRRIKVMPEHNLLLVKGSVPGAKGSILLIEK